MSQLKNEQILMIVTNIAAKHNCRVVDIDFEKHILNIEGPSRARAQCARELAEIFD